MDNANTLDHLLQVESMAAALVYDAQKEADRRAHESEEKNREDYEERYRAQVQRLDACLAEYIGNIKNQYKEQLGKYRLEISGAGADAQKFSALLNEYIAAQG